MKTYLYIFLILLASLLNANDLNEVSWVDEQVNAIKPPREGLKVSVTSLVKDPFIFLDKNKSKKKESGGNGPRVSQPIANAIIPSGITHTQEQTSGSLISEESGALNVDAILNKAALINGKWYQENDIVKGYTLKSVQKTTVILSKSGQEIILSTNSKNLNLKFKNK